jgi:hypothetical protein
MEEYVSIHKIVSLIKQYQQSQVGIGLNSFGFGNIVEFGNTNNTGMTPTYPFVFVTPQNISYEENIVTYNMSLIFADRINDDLSNEVDVVSDMDIQARRFMSFIKRGMNQTPDLYNKMDIVLPTNAVPFQERFNDFVGGVALDCNFVVFTDINACDYYEPEPSPTPSNTPGPTNTPTITPTSTLTPTQTPSSTPNPLCPSQMLISRGIGATPPLFPIGTYNRLSVYSGGSFTAAYAVDNSNVITFGATPDGKNYATYGFVTGTTYYQYIAQISNSTSAFINWISIQSNNDYVFNGGTQVSKGYAVSSGAANNTLFDGSIYYPATGLSNFGTTNSIYISYPISCPTPTPTNTTTPTNTPTPTCPIFTTQYLRTETSGGNNIKLTLFDTSGFTGNANAVCDYTISGTCLEFGITRTWSTTMQSNDHTHTFSTGLGTITNPITTSIIPNCGCVNVIPITTP